MLLYPTNDDILICENHVQVKKDRVDYNNKLCLKPWGEEFMIYETDKVAIWVLKIKKNMSTSLHCHFNKDTLLISLDGCIKLNLYNRDPILMNLMDSVYIQKKAFHGIESLHDESWIMEIEIFGDGMSFSDKNDLLRINDIFNRPKTGYESSVNIVEKITAFPLCINNNIIDLSFCENAVHNIILDGKIYENDKNVGIGSIVQQYNSECVYLSIKRNDYKESRKIIFNQDHLTEVSKNFKNVILTSGCFDILHKGHMKVLKEAKSLGDNLIVCLSCDDQIKRLKGSSRPINNYNDRIEVLKSISYIDYILLYEETNDSTEIVLDKIMKIVKPKYWVKGSEYTKSQILDKHPTLKNIHLVEMENGYSTTQVLNEILATQ
jgi:rfaE bifunctional protein nucleotidyltransferase chain/domain